MIGAGVCLLLSGVVLTIVLKAGRFDPRIYEPDPTDLRGAAAPRPHPLPEIIGRDVRRVTGPEFFPADKLHLKINGRDRAYLAYNVASLTFAAYTAPSLGPDEVQVFVYDMQRPENASGMCRHEYAAGAKPAELGDVAYQAGGSVFFAAGPLLVEIVTIGQTQAHQQAVMQVARAVDPTRSGRPAETK